MKEKKIDEATLAILSMCGIENNLIRLPVGQLECKQYLAVNEILENCGGKWNRKAKAHIFDDDPTDKLEAVLLTGEIIKPQDYGCFYTPPELAKRIVELADIKPDMLVLEPSAGQGAIIELIPVSCELDCFEILPENAEFLEKTAYMNLAGWKSSRILNIDFLTVEPKSLYDRIVMNPPFNMEGNSQLDISHVLHAWKFLKPGSRLVSIMSAGILFRENKKTIAFREMLNRYGFYERNPDGSFKVSGTGVNTITVVLDKPKKD